MTPRWRIRTESGVDVDAGGRLLSVRVHDEEGWKSDSAEILLDDRGGEVRIPPSGVGLDVELGYEERGVRLMGRYAAGEVEASGPPARLRIRATGIDMLGPLKERRTRSLGVDTVGDVAAAIAAEHGLDARIAAAARSVPAQANQVAESDMALVLRLCREGGFECKIQLGRLVVAEAGAGAAASGDAMETVDITQGDCERYRIEWGARQQWASVRARWRDVQGGRTQIVTAGSGSPAYELRDLHASEALASAAARARLAEFARATARLSLSLAEGDSRIVAESRLRLSGWRDGVPADWRVTSVDHSIDRRGYSCDLTAQLAAT